MSIKCLRVNVDKTKCVSCNLGRKVVFRRWIAVGSVVIAVGSVVSGLFVILFSVRNVRGGFIIVALMCPGR